MNDEYVETSYVSSSSLMNIMIWCLVLFRTIYLMLFFSNLYETPLSPKHDLKHLEIFIFLERKGTGILNWMYI